MSDSKFEVADGFVNHPDVTKKISDKGHNFNIAYNDASVFDDMQNRKYNAIVIHQTDTETAQNVFNSYTAEKKGAQFLIDKDGTIYQTASLDKVSRHVGEIRARCLSESTCSKEELDEGLKQWNEESWKKDGSGISGKAKSHDHEKVKDFPDRFPKNEDSIGIECVGKAYPQSGSKEPVYEPLTPEQEKSLKWLTGELAKKYNIPASEIYTHPEIAFKNETEAESAKPMIEEMRREEQIRKEQVENNANKPTAPSNESPPGQQPPLQTPAAAPPVSPAVPSNESQASAGESHNTAEWSLKAEAFRKLPPEKAVQQYPELAPAYASVRAIETKVEADGLPEEHRNTVMSRVHENVAGQIKNGNIPGVQMQEKGLAQAGQSTDLSA